MRKIIHIDMDAFFASIEQRDCKEYQGKPLVVGSPGERGVIAAASYEARKFGVRSAMSSKLASKKCPGLIFAPARFEVYKQVSRQIRTIFFEYTDWVEPLSLDEAFLDVTQNYKNMKIATEIAVEIKDEIFKETNLTASAGVSFNKFLAKIASDCNKPNGIFVISPRKAEQFIEELSIEKFFGIGRKTAEKMHSMGIFFGKDLKKLSLNELIDTFGKTGEIYYQNARAIDFREVNPNRIRKSVGTENTFRKDIDSIIDLMEELQYVAEDLLKRLVKSNFKGKTITLKIKYEDFSLLSRSKTHFVPITDYNTLWNLATELLTTIPRNKKIRLLGLSIKNLEDKPKSISKQLKIPFKEYL